MSDGESRVRRPSVRRVVALSDLRGTMRWLLDRNPREGTLLALAMLSSLIWFVGRVVEPLLLPPGFGGRLTVGLLQAEFVSAMFFRTLMLYALAGLAGLVARAFGGTGSWKDSRSATFLAAVIAAPVMLAATALGATMADVPGPTPAMFRSIGGIAFAWAFSFCIAEAHGFRNGLLVLGVVVAIGLAFMLPFYLLA